MSFDTQWTLENAGVEKSFAAWGLSSLRITYNSQANDSAAFNGPARSFDSAALFAPWSECTIRSGRTGSGVAWTGGVQRFVGLLSKSPRRATGREESAAYELTGAFYYFENLAFEQFMRSYYAPNGTLCDTTDPFACDDSPNGYAVVSDGTHEWELIPMTTCVLNQGQDGFPQTMAAQVKEILDFVLSKMVAPKFQYSGAEIDAQFGALQLPTNERPELTCAAALQQELAWVPDCETWFDYATVPPTFHVKRRGNLTPVSVDANPASGAPTVESLEVADREDLAKSQVHLLYRRPDTLDGRVWLLKFDDKFPPGDPADPFNVLKQTIDLFGFSGATQVAHIVTQDIPSDLNAVGSQQFWKNHVPWLARMTLASGAITASTRKVVTDGVVTATNGTNATHPRKLASGNVPDWLTSVVVQEEEFKCIVTYTMPDGKVLEDEELVFRIRTTDAETTDYTSTAVDSEAEAVPTGLAEQVYNALNAPQFEGGFSTVAEEAGTNLALGQKVNLTNGHADWATMAMPLKSVTLDADEGRVAVRFGPNRHLNAGELLELMRVTRTRRVTFLTGTRASGSGAAGGEVSTGRDGDKENTATGPGRYQTFVVAKEDDGSVGTHGRMKIATAAYPGSPTGDSELKHTTLGTDIRPRETLICDADGNEEYCMVLRSARYSTRKTTGDIT